MADIKILTLKPQTFHKSSQTSKGITYPVGADIDVSQNGLCPVPIHYIVIQYPQQMVQMAYCDLSHTYYKQVTNVSPACFCHPTLGNFDVSPYIKIILPSAEALSYINTKHMAVVIYYVNE